MSNAKGEAASDRKRTGKKALASKKASHRPPVVGKITANSNSTGSTEKAVQQTRAPSVNRAVSILALLANSDTPLGINSIAREVGIVASTCHHIIRALEQEGLIIVDPVNRRCSIGLGLVRLARRALNQNLSDPNAQVEIDKLAEEFGVTISITRLSSRERLMIIGVAEPQAPLAIRVNIGHQLPAWSSATGRLYAAILDLPQAKLRKVFEGVRWANPPSIADWLADVEYAKEHKISVDRGNYVAGIEIHATPIMEYGKMQGTLAALVSVGGISRAKESDLHAKLRATGERLSI